MGVAFMKILHLYDHTLPLQSGYVVRSCHLRYALKKLGHHQIILSGVRHYSRSSFEYHGNETIEGEYYYRTPPHVCRLPFLEEIADILVFARRIYQLLKENPIDVIHVHSPCLNGYAALLARFFHRLMYQKNPKIHYEIRALWEEAALNHGTCFMQRLKYKISQKMETFLCQRVDKIFPISLGLIEEFASRGIERAKMYLVPNVVSDHVPTAPVFLSELAGNYGLEQHHLILGFIGSFYHYEGLLDAIDMIEYLKNKNDNYRLLLVGDGIAMPAIQAKITQKNLEKYVICTGKVPMQKVADYYGLCTAMIYPRHNIRLTATTTPLKPLEAMLMQKLVFASDIMGHQELIQHTQTGYLLPQIPLKAQADFIDQHLHDQAEIKKITQHAFWWVQEHRAAIKVAQNYGY